MPTSPQVASDRASRNQFQQMSRAAYECLDLLAARLLRDGLSHPNFEVPDQLATTETSADALIREFTSLSGANVAAVHNNPFAATIVAAAVPNVDQLQQLATHPDGRALLGMLEHQQRAYAETRARIIEATNDMRSARDIATGLQQNPDRTRAVFTLEPEIKSEFAEALRGAPADVRLPLTRDSKVHMLMNEPVALTQSLTM